MHTVDRVRRIRPLFVDIAKVGKISCKRITIKVNDMFGVHRANGIVHPLVKHDDGRVARVCGLVQGIVPRDPLVLSVVTSKRRP